MARYDGSARWRPRFRGLFVSHRHVSNGRHPRSGPCLASRQGGPAPREEAASAAIKASDACGAKRRERPPLQRRLGRRTVSRVPGVCCPSGWSWFRPNATGRDVARARRARGLPAGRSPIHAARASRWTRCPPCAGSWPCSRASPPGPPTATPGSPASPPPCCCTSAPAWPTAWPTCTTPAGRRHPGGRHRRCPCHRPRPLRRPAPVRYRGPRPHRLRLGPHQRPPPDLARTRARARRRPVRPDRHPDLPRRRLLDRRRPPSPPPAPPPHAPERDAGRPSQPRR